MAQEATTKETEMTGAACASLAEERQKLHRRVTSLMKEVALGEVPLDQIAILTDKLNAVGHSVLSAMTAADLQDLQTKLDAIEAEKRRFTS